MIHEIKNVHPDEDLEKNEKSVRTSCCWQPLCLRLTRLTGGILFGIIIVVTCASIGGLIASTLLYLQNSNSNSQWEMLGIAVCSAMLITILLILCVLVYYFKNDRNATNSNTKSLATPEYNQEDVFWKSKCHARSNGTSSLSYEMIQNIPPLSTNKDVIQVEDKQTNTEKTFAPLRPRNFQRGVWPAMNAYGGLSSRPLEKPKMVNRYIQTLPNEINQTMSQRQNNVINNALIKIIRLPENNLDYNEEQYPNRFIEQKPQYAMIEKIIERPKERSREDKIGVAELATTNGERIHHERKKKRFFNVSIERVKAIEKSNVV
ncbi:unnamed protein product [Rotaria sp. Silwood2]|nr:unnamed protein product [Rotaria sp. Silwood2]CAF4034284.1 unnamed protein product [Rotaria sp. Silwood2]